MTVVTLAIALAFEMLTATTNTAIYYRPHEKFSGPDLRYSKNVHFEMAMPHGDLKALALHTEVETEPRHVVFETDSLGFRNARDYHGQKYLLVGDSFIVGNGTSQQDILTEQLLNKHGIDSYNLSYPGGVKEYYSYVKSFKGTDKQDAKVILFLFEGNDFPLNKDPAPVITNQSTAKSNPIIQNIKAFYRSISKTNMYRFIYSATRRLIAEYIKNNEEQVETGTIGKLPIAFLKHYIDVTERDFLPENLETELYISAMKDDIEHIFFIPTKYRVYYNLVNNHKQQNDHALPDKQWEYAQSLGQKFNIPTTNLTPALIEESEKLLGDDALTYWKDDTHWNRYGISVAAEIISKKISPKN
jgi:hypothetical protein